MCFLIFICIDRKRLVAGIVAAGIVAVFLARIVVPVDGIISFLRDMIIVLGITIFSKPLIKKNEGISFFNYRYVVQCNVSACTTKSILSISKNLSISNNSNDIGDIAF